MTQAITRVLGISGSLRRDSFNTKLLAVAADGLPARVEYQRYEALRDIPPFNADDEGTPPAAVSHFRSLLDWADAVIIATPEYNASIPGQLKNAFDWASRPVTTAALRGLAVAVIGASTSSFGATWAQDQLRGSLGAAGARVVDLELAVAEVEDQLSDDGIFRDPQLLDQLTAILDALMAEADIAATERDASAPLGASR
ncbi:NADPH-dependent FMN reductase [Rhodococcus sp. JS3073]|uniref:NADPH-dependent FMN reductase n=1 Tax=Rhodococcus sp. JS3073 TaxID=3002901 RepID=UPI00228591DD|nr:NAD(P)H-dependent oxidoreductase [Rhodococcus sp. JS3073]WAM19154.1 NAD(P)H-dependent oxidoreductase [Rhodococcus sp. JS3073]